MEGRRETLLVWVIRYLSKRKEENKEIVWTMSLLIAKDILVGVKSRIKNDNSLS